MFVYVYLKDICMSSWGRENLNEIELIADVRTFKKIMEAILPP